MEDQNDSNRVDSEFEEAVPVYANNVRFEMTAWDLRVLFGQLASTTISGRTWRGLAHGCHYTLDSS